MHKKHKKSNATMASTPLPLEASPPPDVKPTESSASKTATAAAVAHRLKAKVKEKAHLHHKGETVHQLAGTYRLEGHKALLHGNLHIKIIKCENLKNMDCTCILAPSCLVNDVSDPYVAVYAGEHRLAKSSYKLNDLNPVWNEDFYVPVAHYVENLRFEVKDRDFNLYAQMIGETFLPVQDLLQWDENGKPLRVGIHRTAWLDNKESHGNLQYFVDYVPVELLQNVPMQVPGVYFQQTDGNIVKLFVNADEKETGVPQLLYGLEKPSVSFDNEGGVEMGDPEMSVWHPLRLWRDTYDAICQAKHMIYITGWSVDVTQSLLRGEEMEEALKNGKYSPYIGELLKQKAEEGVVVNMLVWDDATSNDLLAGMMGTKDEEARKCFHNTKVNFRLAPMMGDEKNNVYEKGGKFVMFTHHQKLVVVDTPQLQHPKKRELLAFVGGIDLTYGRWDNSTHPLFRTLTTLHKGDCHNACFNVNPAEAGPREPWHDIHSCVRGPGTLDVVENFVERWKKQASSDVDKLVDLEALGLKNPPANTAADSWSTQLFRSIDARTCEFDENRMSKYENHTVDELEQEGVQFRTMPSKQGSILHLDSLKDLLNMGKSETISRSFKTSDTSTFHYDRGLALKKGRNIDKSVEAGMVHHIRRAQHVVYIESQYFLSSSHMWPTSTKTKCGNLIAAELTLKICQKIEDGERFAAYILVPMWPEGIPESAAVQAILRFQALTMESMYKRIALALKRRKEAAKKHDMTIPDAHPRDYLNFYTLANRETEVGDKSTRPPAPRTDEPLLAKTRRHLIYVHSKMVMVDDEIVLIGSANINQRSLDGARDSEIVLGSWQPSHLATKDSIAHGDVHGFRLHCWESIMGTMEDVFRDPSSIACVHRVNEIAEKNWKAFSSDEVTDMESHLLPYPVTVSKDGSVTSGNEFGDDFVDTRAKITGSKTKLPEILTT